MFAVEQFLDSNFTGLTLDHPKLPKSNQAIRKIAEGDSCLILYHQAPSDVLVDLNGQEVPLPLSGLQFVIEGDSNSVTSLFEQPSIKEVSGREVITHNEIHLLGSNGFVMKKFQIDPFDRDLNQALVTYSYFTFDQKETPLPSGITPIKIIDENSILGEEQIRSEKTSKVLLFNNEGYYFDVVPFSESCEVIGCNQNRNLVVRVVSEDDALKRPETILFIHNRGIHLDECAEVLEVLQSGTTVGLKEVSLAEDIRVVPRIPGFWLNDGMFKPFPQFGHGRLTITHAAEAEDIIGQPSGLLSVGHTMLGEFPEAMIWAYPYFSQQKECLHRPLSDMTDTAVDRAYNITKSGFVLASVEGSNFILLPDSKIDSYVTV
jgi:hypothetical protein